MKRFLVLLFWLLPFFVWQGYAATPSLAVVSYAVVQTAHNSAAASTGLTATVSSTGSGNLLVVIIYTTTTGETFTCTDSASQSYTQAYQFTANGTTQAVYYFSGTASGVTSVSTTATISTNSIIIVREYSISGATWGTLDVSSTNSGTSDPQDSGTTSATSTTNELIIGTGSNLHAFSSYPLMSVGSGYSNFEEDELSVSSILNAAAIEDKQVTSTGTQSATFGNPRTGTVSVGVAAFKMTVAGGSNHNGLLLTGVG